MKEVFAAESGGMPQLNPEFWISQIFWLTLTFGILYIVLSKLILPKISANLELRKSQIQENIEAAENQRKSSESKLKEYDDINLKSALVTDDYRLQNLAEKAGIEWETVSTKGIKEIWKWELRCIACKKMYPQPEKPNQKKSDWGECEDCGSKLKLKKIR